MLSFTPFASAQADRVSCGFFETQEDAQTALDDRPELADVLDGDGDGIACEELRTGGPVVVDPVSCGFFETQEDAQAALDDNPGLATTLDSDGDGIACDDAFEAGGPADPVTPVVDGLPSTGTGAAQASALNSLVTGLVILSGAVAAIGLRSRFGRSLA
jgi:hypothetical protein